MGLVEQIQKEEEELKKLEEAESKAAGETKEETTEEPKKEEATEEPEEEEATEEPEEEGSDEEGVEEKELSEAEKNNYAAQLRRERKEKRELQERLAALTKTETKEQPREEHKPVEKLTVEQRLERIEEEKQQKELHRSAIEEFNAIEADFSKQHADYEAASAHMIQTLFTSVKNLNPGISDQQAVATVQNHVLQIASQAAVKGQNPAEVLYDMAFDVYGFKSPANAVKEPAGAENKLDLKKTGKAENLKVIAKNRKKSASALNGGGQSTSTRASVQEAANMDLATFGKLSEAEMDRLISQA